MSEFLTDIHPTSTEIKKNIKPTLGDIFVDIAEHGLEYFDEQDYACFGGCEYVGMICHAKLYDIVLDVGMNSVQIEAYDLSGRQCAMFKVEGNPFQ